MEMNGGRFSGKGAYLTHGKCMAGARKQHGSKCVTTAVRFHKLLQVPSHVELANKVAVFNEVRAMQTDRENDMDSRGSVIAGAAKVDPPSLFQVALAKLYELRAIAPVMDFARVNSKMRCMQLVEVYARMEGYTRLLGELHAQQLVVAVEIQVDEGVPTLTPATEVWDVEHGQFPHIQRVRGNGLPNFTLVEVDQLSPENRIHIPS
jgi:hypothetical protein